MSNTNRIDRLFPFYSLKRIQGWDGEVQANLGGDEENLGVRMIKPLYVFIKFLKNKGI